MRTPRASWLGLLALGLLAGGVPARAASGPARVAPYLSNAVRCDGAIQHPLAVRAVALDPVVRGQVVRVRVTTTSRHAVDRGEVRLTSTGGAALMSAPRQTFTRLVPEGRATSDFAVRLPAEGKRFLLQFRVQGDGPSGAAARGATLNLLPDDAVESGRLVTASDGRRIVEYPARRADQ